MRLNETLTEFASARASCVLPVPGLSSSSTWPPATSAVTHWRIGVSLPTTACETLSTIAEKWRRKSAISSLLAVPASATAPIGGSVCTVDAVPPSAGEWEAEDMLGIDETDGVDDVCTAGVVVVSLAATIVSVTLTGADDEVEADVAVDVEVDVVETDDVARTVPSSSRSPSFVVCVCSNISRVGRSGMTTCGTDGFGIDVPASTVSSALAAAASSTADSWAPARTVSSSMSCSCGVSLCFVIC